MDLSATMPLAAMGLLGTLRTGNAAVDSVLACLLPALAAWVSAHAGAWVRLVGERFKARLGLHAYRFSREVSQRTRETHYGRCYQSPGNSNGLLIKALERYTATLLQAGEMMFPTAAVELGEPAGEEGTSCYSDDSSDDEAEGGADGEGPRMRWMRKLRVLPRLPEDVWVKVPGKEHGHVSVLVSRNRDSTGEGTHQIWCVATSMRVASCRSQEAVDAFIDAAWAWWIKRAAETAKKRHRFMFMPVPRKSGKEDDNNEAGPFVYKRYRLSDAKTFDSVFMPAKQELLTLLGHFENGTGKFAVPGFPHKLGLLLHGPPGTGKTSLIKALASRTGRHVVHVPLARIKTNHELQSIMQDLRFRFAGGGDDDDDVSSRFSFSQLIFVFEDVDVVDAVQRRDSAASPPRRAPSPPRPVLVTSEGAGDDEKAGSGRTTPPLTCRSGSSRAAAASAWTTVTGKGASSLWFEEDDALDLAGILNVLDGVIDAPGRVVVLTTNHPEKLDPALIRPGRVNKSILLDFLRPPEATEMVRHHFPGAATGEELEHLGTALERRCAEKPLTPAELEEACAESDSVAELVERLLAKDALPKQAAVLLAAAAKQLELEEPEEDVAPNHGRRHRRRSRSSRSKSQRASAAAAG